MKWRFRRNRHRLFVASPYSLDDLFAPRNQLWDQRKLTTTFITYDENNQPTTAFDTLGHYAAIWPFEVGAPE